MHCVSTYPAEAKDINLSTIEQMRDEYKCDVGYSGHENGIVVSLAAVMLGITSLERHITLDRIMYGSDQAASLEAKGLNEMIAQIFYAGFDIGELTCPTKYFDEASSINFKRSSIYGLGVLKVSILYRLNKWGVLTSKIFKV